MIAGLVCAAGVNSAAAAAAVPPPQMHTVAGGGSCSGAVTSGGSCDNVAATSVPIAGARSVAALPGGGYLYIDYGNDLVREVTAAGKVITVAGTSAVLNNQKIPDQTDVDGVPATQSGLDDPVAVAALPSGGFLITEYGGNRVREVSPGAPGTATITTIDGTPPAEVPPPTSFGGANPGTAGAGADQLYDPTDAVPTADGGVLIADYQNDRIMKLDSWSNPSTLTQIAGGGACVDAASTCNGAQATQVALDQPDSVSELPGQPGTYLIAEQGASAVREVSAESASGTFTTVAGRPGSPGYAGDGGPAASAQLNQPEQVLALAGGGYLIADTANDSIREVSPAGSITTIGGSGPPSGDSGDGGSATAAQLNDPTAVAPTIFGGILIADNDNSVIREISIAPTSYVYFRPSVPNGANGWFTVDPVIAVTADQNAAISCVLDPGQAPPVYAAIIPGCTYATAVQAVTQNGPHTLWVASENSLGDDQSPISVSFKIDTTPPTVTCGKEPVFAHHQRSPARVTGTLTDSISGPASLALKVRVSTTTPGTFKATVAGTDNAGLTTSVECPYRVRGHVPPPKRKRKRK